SDCQGERNITEALERMLCDSHQNQTLTEDLASENKCTLDPCTVLTARRKTCAQKCQVDQTQKGSTTSADRKANIKAVLKKIDCQGDEDIIEALEKMLCASHQDETSFEDLANADQNMLGMTTVLTSLRKCCAHKHQVQPRNFSSKADRPEGTGVGQQQDDFKKNLIDMLDKFLTK
ncbi:hypothetical protein A6R68_24046, partial [Neotoma lepida]